MKIKDGCQRGKSIKRYLIEEILFYFINAINIFSEKIAHITKFPGALSRSSYLGGPLEMEALIVTKCRVFAGVRRTAKKSIGILFRKRPRFMKIRVLESAASPPGILWFGFNDLAHFFRTCVTKWSLRNSPPRLSNSRGFAAYARGTLHGFPL